MSRIIRPGTGYGLARSLRPVGPAPSIVSYRLVDLTEIFSLYLKVVEIALRRSTESAGLPTDDGGRRARTGKPPRRHPV